MNDVYIGVSWASVDWYGVPKMAHYFTKDAFEPLHAAVIVDTLTYYYTPCALPVFIMDDNDALKKAKWQVTVRAFDSELNEIKKQVYKGKSSINQVKKLGDFKLTSEQTKTAPLLIVTDVVKNGKCVDKSFCWLNFRVELGCLFDLPKTALSVSFKEGQAIIENIGDKPAVGVYFDCPEISDTFRAQDSYFWLDVGETKAVQVNRVDKVAVKAWNVGP